MSCLGELIVKLLAVLFFVLWPARSIRTWCRNNRWHFKFLKATYVYLTRDVDRIDRSHDEKHGKCKAIVHCGPGSNGSTIRNPNYGKQMVSCGRVDDGDFRTSDVKALLDEYS
jgi:hypothetical protein